MQLHQIKTELKQVPRDINQYNVQSQENIITYCWYRTLRMISKEAKEYVLLASCGDFSPYNKQLYF